MIWRNNEFSPEEKASFEQLRKEEQPKLQIMFTANQKTGIEMVDMVRNLLIHARANNWSEISSIWNAVGYIAMLSLDIKTYIKILLSLDHEYDRKAILRVVILNIHEGINDIHKLVGGNFSKTLIDLQVSKEVLADLKLSKNTFTDFKNKYHSDLNTFRNTAVAHRDFDFLRYTEFVSGVEETSIFHIVMEFDDALNKIGKTMTAIMNETTANFIKIKYGKANIDAA